MQQSVICSDEFKNPKISCRGKHSEEKGRNLESSETPIKMQISTLWLTLLRRCKRNHSEIFLIFLLHSTFMNFSTENLNSSISNFDFLTEFPLMHFADKNEFPENIIQTVFDGGDSKLYIFLQYSYAIAIKVIFNSFFLHISLDNKAIWMNEFLKCLRCWIRYFPVMEVE